MVTHLGHDLATFDEISSTLKMILDEYEDVLNAKWGLCKTMGTDNCDSPHNASSIGYIYWEYSISLIIR